MILGIDIGLRGAAVLLENAGRVLAAWTMPVTGPASAPTGFNPGAIAGVVRDSAARAWEANAILDVAMEAPQTVRIYGRVQPKPTARLAECAALWRAACAELVPPVAPFEVAPATWQAAVGIRRGNGRDMKAQALAIARYRWPGHVWEHDGIVDAALIADYRRCMPARLLAGGRA